MSMYQERVFDAFGLTEEERQFIREDADGYQAARKEADEQREAFSEYVGRRIAEHREEIERRLGEEPKS